MNHWLLALTDKPLRHYYSYHLSDHLNVHLSDFIERQISKHLKLDRIEAKILDEDNKNLYFMWGKIRRRYTKGNTFTLLTGQASKLVH